MLNSLSILEMVYATGHALTREALADRAAVDRSAMQLILQGMQGMPQISQLYSEALTVSDAKTTAAADVQLGVTNWRRYIDQQVTERCKHRSQCMQHVHQSMQTITSVNHWQCLA